jgi:hypothetical protein
MRAPVQSAAWNSPGSFAIAILLQSRGLPVPERHRRKAVPLATLIRVRLRTLYPPGPISLRVMHIGSFVVVPAQPVYGHAVGSG